MKSFGFACLFFLGFALLESAVLSNILILPAVPDFILLYLVCWFITYVTNHSTSFSICQDNSMITVSKGLIPPVFAHGWGNDLGTRSNSCNYVSIPDKNGESFRGFPFFSFMEQIYSFSDALVIPT